MTTTSEGSKGRDAAARVRRWMRRFYRPVRKHRRPISLAAYAFVAAVAYTLALVASAGGRWPAANSAVFVATLPVLLVARAGTNRLLTLSAVHWRYAGLRDVGRLAVATLAGTIVFLAATRVLPRTPGVPLTVVWLEAVLTAGLTAGAWVVYRAGFEWVRQRRATGLRDRRRVLIVGAGEAGNMLAREMLRFPTGHRPVGFVDDDPLKWHHRLHGLEVLGGTEDLAALAQARHAQELFIAVPSASPDALRVIVERCEATGLPFKVLPGIAEVLAGSVRLAQLRDVRIEDLLGREPIQLELPELAAELRGRTVLITGAAGSIGSELSRQIALHRPGRLVLFDQAETDLFYLELELRERYPDLPLTPVVGDIADAGTVDRVFTIESPALVFHAAAYKHVPMMEMNPGEAVRNNVIGTWRIAEAAGLAGVEKFVLVSTDKAVRPANVMGATKRLAEMIVLELQRRYPATHYGAVRFGNVLGSQGSVIPIFRKQLEQGKPLTVTHPDVSRYFMTIPEAVQLILQASLLTDLRGRIAMLDMGSPVRIVDLARNLLRLSGAPLDVEDGIVFTGLRPGEKLHEELVAPEESTSATAVPKVQLLQSGYEMTHGVLSVLVAWERMLEEGRTLPVLQRLEGMFPGLHAHSDAQLTEPPTERRVHIA